jgi:two-component system, OmpR family, lantibiotic biosynthesis response regulator NisR/SpaR
MYEKILIADDEEGMISFLKDVLISEGYEVLVAMNGEEAIKGAKMNPDLVILDIMMPDLSGYEVCQAIRDEISCPIIFLSALQSEFDKIKGFSIGGDDYLTKPFSTRELKVRIQAHLRRERRSNVAGNKAILRFGNLAIDLKGHAIFHNGNQIVFTRREFDIVELLAMHPGIVFSKDQIYEKIWGYDAMGDSACVAEHIKKIRAKFVEENPETEYISTVWGVGYKWKKS